MAPGIVFTNFFLCNLQMGNAGVWHYIRLEGLAMDKHSCSLEPVLSYEENKGLWIRPLVLCSQTFFFVTYKWVKYAGVLNHGTVEKLTMDKHSSLLDPSLSYEENKGFWIRPLVLYSQTFFFVTYKWVTLECNITSGWKHLPGTNTLAYWTLL